MNMVQVDQKAPVFTLPDQQGNVHALSNYAGQWILLYFYPKDDTPGCTEEACNFRDNLSALKEKGVTVIGVSTDSVESHQTFAKKYDLPFTLLADTNKEVVTAYGVWAEKMSFGQKTMGTLRTSFLIRPDGTIAKVYERVKPAEHIGEILHDTNAMIS